MLVAVKLQIKEIASSDKKETSKIMAKKGCKVLNADMDCLAMLISCVPREED